MDYEKAYKDALERAKEFQKSKDGLCVLTAESIFPELKESEDERMLNELIIGFYGYKDKYPNFWKLRTDDIIEWLKKKKDEQMEEIRG